MLSREGRPTPLGDAIAHYGRIAKTLHILRLADEPGYRRQIKVQANLQEGPHALARKVFHGRAGQLYQRYQDGLEDQIGALGLVLNALVLFNRRYMDAAVNQLRADGFDVRDEDVARLLAVRAAPHQHARPAFLPAPPPARRPAAAPRPVLRQRGMTSCALSRPRRVLTSCRSGAGASAAAVEPGSSLWAPCLRTVAGMDRRFCRSLLGATVLWAELLCGWPSRSSVPQGLRETKHRLTGLFAYRTEIHLFACFFRRP